MDARHYIVALTLCMVWTPLTFGQRLSQSRSRNFVVVAATPELAREVAETAEQLRSELSQLWLGYQIQDWPAPCPLQVQCHPRLLAGGKTTFTFYDGTVRDWEMEVSGTRERILDSVLPHEITHTIFATHFAPMGKPVPRWADEGACTTVEHISERSKHDQNLVDFLQTRRAMPFAVMFSLRDYPHDIMPLYAQGYSVSSFLIAQVGHQNFVKFLEEGMQSEDWVSATEKYFGYPLIGKLQVAWNAWVEASGGRVDNFTAQARGFQGSDFLLASFRDGAPNNSLRGDSNVRLASNNQPLANPPSFNGPSFNAPSVNSPSLGQPALNGASEETAGFAIGGQTPVGNMSNRGSPSMDPNDAGHYQRLLQMNQQGATNNATRPTASLPPPGNPQPFPNGASTAVQPLTSPGPSSLTPPPPSYRLSDSQSSRKPNQESRQGYSGRSVINR